MKGGLGVVEKVLQVHVTAFHCGMIFPHVGKVVAVMVMEEKEQNIGVVGRDAKGFATASTDDIIIPVHSVQ